MDIKCEIKMKDEPLENTQDNALIVWNSEQVSELEIVERNSSPNSGVKNEFGIEDEPLEIEMKEPSFEQLSEVDETRSLIINGAEGEKDNEVKSTLRSKPPKAVVHQESICRYFNFSFENQDELKTYLETHNKKF
ncbi:UNVERIFIED_CONTAM: hypothetical protein RMT77_014563 [Armadillidium vulgare]